MTIRAICRKCQGCRPLLGSNVKAPSGKLKSIPNFLTIIILLVFFLMSDFYSVLNAIGFCQ